MRSERDSEDQGKGLATTATWEGEGKNDLGWWPGQGA